MAKDKKKKPKPLVVRTGHEIVKTQSTKHDVTLTLENGMVIQVCSNDGYVHVHFSGIGSGQVTATPMSHLGESLKQELDVSNYINLFYPNPEKR